MSNRPPPAPLTQRRRGCPHRHRNTDGDIVHTSRRSYATGRKHAQSFSRQRTGISLLDV